MPRKEISTEAERRWERQLARDYRDACYHDTLEALYQQLQAWHDGEIGSDEADRAVHEAHSAMQKLYGLFRKSRTFVAKNAMMDEEWFEEWVAGNPPPPGTELPRFDDD